MVPEATIRPAPGESMAQDLPDPVAVLWLPGAHHVSDNRDGLSGSITPWAPGCSWQKGGPGMMVPVRMGGAPLRWKSGGPRPLPGVRLLEEWRLDGHLRHQLLQRRRCLGESPVAATPGGGLVLSTSRCPCAWKTPSKRYLSAAAPASGPGWATRAGPPPLILEYVAHLGGQRPAIH